MVLAAVASIRSYASVLPGADGTRYAPRALLLTVLDCADTVGVAPVTMTVSVSAPTDSVIFTLTGRFSPIRTSRRSVLKPVSATVNVARPIGTDSNVKAPLTSLTAVRLMRAVANVTSAPGMRPPIWSTTTPVTV